MAIPSTRYSIVTSIFAASAFLLSWEAAVSCRFISFSSTLGFSQPVTMRFGIWTWEDWTFITSTGGTTVVYETCNHYPSDVKMDSKWKECRAFSTIGLIIGVVFLFSNLFSSCLSRPRQGYEAFAFLAIAIFQGLSLLLLKSALCKDNGLVLKLREEVQLEDFEMDGTCSMHTGANCTIAAVVLWFLAGLTSRMASLVEKSEVESNSTTDPLISAENL